MTMNNNHIASLDSAYSTTRRVLRGNPFVENSDDSMLQYMLQLPPHAERKGEGGLRTRGYFKSGGHFNRNSEDASTCPLVTIITVVINGAAHLEQAVLSVLNQSYDNIEYIIIDGGSTDGTLAIIGKYEHAIDYWVSEPDTGIYDAWNKAVCLSSGDWIAFLGADDVYLQGAIQMYVNSIIECRNNLPEYISSRVNLIENSQVVRTIGQQWNWNTFRKHMNVAHVGSFHNRTLFEKYGLFDAKYKICGDYEYLLRPGSGLRAAYLNRITVNMGIGGVSNNLSAFCEGEKAKTTTGGRSVFLSRIEKIIAVSKWKLRKWLWH